MFTAPSTACVVTGSIKGAGSIDLEMMRILTMDNNLREFPTPVILDQAREGAALRCKNEINFCALKVAQECVVLTGRFARNGGYGSIEESEILNLRWDFLWYGVISGCAFLHCKKGTKADLNAVPPEPCRFRSAEDVRADDDTSHVAQAGSTARLGGRQNRIQPLLGSCRQITGTPE